MFALSLLAVAMAGGEVTQALRDPLPLYDENGREIERVAAGTVIPAQFDGENDFGDLAVTHDGRTVYLRVSDVKFTGGGCEKRVSASDAGSSKVAASRPGARAGAGSESTRCVLK